MENCNNNRHIERHIVLVAPEVHWNTGNIGRTCLGADASLHLIKPLGFSLESREVKRAGLDYWTKVKLHVWENFEDFLCRMAPLPEQMAFFSKSAEKTFWSMPAQNRLFLIFGSETRGLPEYIVKSHSDKCYYIPITDEIRCLNLSTSVGIAIYESLRLSNTCRDFHQY